ncbi:MAG: hypothetical protein Q8N23_19380 [Archangium sp.]|nr:hypothetical protein [Archangium sp.]MDP3154849.1 hypothetical protein [Archangium sp.]MDP3575015.1 hypothetical protein [Archangium sp.]
MKLFLPHKTLEDWMVSEKADLQDGKLFVTEGKASFPVAAGVHFAKLVSGEDTQGLLGRVKTSAQLSALNAEHFQDSCIVGEAAYEVVEGYVTEVAAAATARSDPKKKTGSPEADLLAAFILDKL